MIGEARRWRFKNAKSQLDKVAKTNGRVMLTGPPGSGKEVAARFIHAIRPRPRPLCHRQLRRDGAGADGRGRCSAANP
jgi:DNA-binding NtrC family response regulator